LQQRRDDGFDEEDREGERLLIADQRGQCMRLLDKRVPNSIGSLPTGNPDALTGIWLRRRFQQHTQYGRNSFFSEHLSLKRSGLAIGERGVGQQSA